MLVANPSEHDIIIETGGPPFHITGDPTQSGGLFTSIRIANDEDPLNAGPGIDSWGGSRDTFPAGRAKAGDYTLRIRDWKAGWSSVKPGLYRVRGYYNGREGTSAEFILKP